MSKYRGLRNIVFRATSLALLATLAACGGRDDTENQAECTDNIILLIICSVVSSGSAAPDQAPISPNDSGVTGMATSTVGSSAVTAEMVRVHEFEPNNVLDNANIVALSGGLGGDSRGLEFKGSVQSNDDAADHFVFTPNQGGAYRIYLCADTCSESLNDDAAYIMIYDQNQTTIAGTPIGTIVRQEIDAELTAGLAYYVEINGYNAGAEDYDYRLVVSN